LKIKGRALAAVAENPVKPESNEKPYPETVSEPVQQEAQNIDDRAGKL
jgi:hypothetical protein